MPSLSALAQTQDPQRVDPHVHDLGPLSGDGSFAGEFESAFPARPARVPPVPPPSATGSSRRTLTVRSTISTGGERDLERLERAALREPNRSASEYRRSASSRSRTYSGERVLEQHLLGSVEFVALDQAQCVVRRGRAGELAPAVPAGVASRLEVGECVVDAPPPQLRAGPE